MIEAHAIDPKEEPGAERDFDPAVAAKLIEEDSFCDALLYAAHSKEDVASLDILEDAFLTIDEEIDLTGEQRSALSDVMASAHLMMLDIQGAHEYLTMVDDDEKTGWCRMEDLLKVALWYPHAPELVKDMLSDPVSELTDTYSRFLTEVALPHIPMGKDIEGFFLDDGRFSFLMSELRAMDLDPVETMANIVRKMDDMGNRNAPKRLLLAQETGDEGLISSAAQFCDDTKALNRKGLDALVNRYTAVSGRKVVRKMQQGDTDSFFPVASNIYLIEKEGEHEVWKENLHLYTDFSMLDGYNCEKEIYDLLKADTDCPRESFIDYRGSISIEGNEFLRFGFFSGRELTDFISDEPEKRLPVKQAARVVRSIAKTLEYLQSKGVMYMDVKDKNFLYDGETVKILDFGMAQMFDTPVERDTEARSLLSTPAYIPPEWGETFSAYATSEVFQLGVLFHQLITGRHPFAHYDFTEGDEHRESEIMKYSLPNMYNRYQTPEALQDEPKLDSIIRSMLDKDHTARPGMHEVVRSLECYIIDSILDGPEDWPEKAGGNSND